MSLCKHCSSPTNDPVEAFCCRGCESVFQLIHEDGLGLFYELKNEDSLTPLREKPFQHKDWSWLNEASHAAQRSQPNSPVLTLSLGLSGLSCMACVWLVETVVKKQPGVIESCVNNQQGSIDITYQPADTDLSILAESLHKLGYEILAKKLGLQAGTAPSVVIRLGICGALAMNTMAFTLPRYNGMETSSELSSLLTTVTIASSTLTLLIGGSYFFKRAWLALKLGGVHMDLPISIGLILSYIGSIIGWATGHEALFYFDFVAIFTFLMLLGKHIQISSLNRANSRFQTDTTIPEFYFDEDRQSLPTSEIPEDTKLRIPPATVIPAECRLLSQSADLSLAWITGEPTSRLFQHTDPIPAGAINQSAQEILVQTTQDSQNDTAVKQILELSNQQNQIIHRQAKQKAIQLYLVIILVIGLVAGGSWWLTTHDWVKALQVLISIYVVSCPCGIGLALPLLDTRHSKLAQNKGIFPLTPRFWEQLNRVTKVVFDKTGTLTLDKPALCSPEQLTQLSDRQRDILFALTRSSLHPLSRSLFSALINHGTTQTSISADPVETPGKGVEIQIDANNSYGLGRPLEEHNKQNNLICSFTHNGTPITQFHFTEAPRQRATESLDTLNTLMPSPSMILSGDSSHRVAKIARQLHIPEYKGDLLPEEKRREIEQLEKSGKTLYLGDGINDLPALQTASLSGAPFANINMLTDDVDFLFTDETMTFLPRLIHLSQQHQFLKRILIAYTILYNLVALSFCISGHMSPLVAAIIMPLSSLLSLAIVSRTNKRQ